MLVTGSGEELIASRPPALTRWLSNAVPPPTDAEDGLVERGGVAGEQDADDRAGGGTDRGGDRVPGGVDVGDLVGDELHRVEEAGHREHVPPAQHVGDLGEGADPVGDAQHEDDEVGVDAARPPAGEGQCQGVHRSKLPRSRGDAQSTWTSTASVIATSSS